MEIKPILNLVYGYYKDKHTWVSETKEEWQAAVDAEDSK
jgi:hypothetical protein